MALAAVLLGLLALGHVAAALAGERVEAGEERSWTGERWYVAPTGAGACRLSGTDVGRTIVLERPARSEIGLDLVASHEFLTPGGAVIGGREGASGALRCDVDVRVTRGLTSFGPSLGEGGLLVAGPAAVLLVAGLTLQRPQR